MHIDPILLIQHIDLNKVDTFIDLDNISLKKIKIWARWVKFLFIVYNIFKLFLYVLLVTIVNVVTVNKSFIVHLNLMSVYQKLSMCIVARLCLCFYGLINYRQLRSTTKNIFIRSNPFGYKTARSLAFLNGILTSLNLNADR